MNELYYDPLSYKSRIVLILDELKKITDPDTANSVLFSVFQNLKYYVKEIRNNLRCKLRELGLLQSVSNRRSPARIRSRRYSADFISENSQETRLSWWNEGMQSELKPFHGAEGNYIEFLAYLCEIYKNFSKIAARGPEGICRKLLSLCKSTTEIAEYDVHKTVFYDYVLEDRIISVNLL
jgi:Cdc6-like AAA superfamily ATPase